MVMFLIDQVGSEWITQFLFKLRDMVWFRKKKKGRKKEVQITHNYFMPKQSDRTYLLILLSFGIFNTTCNILGVFAVSSMR